MKVENCQEATKRLMKERKMSQTGLGQKLGKTAGSIHDSLFRTSGMSVDKFVEYMTAMGYELVVKDTISGKEVAKVGRDEE